MQNNKDSSIFYLQKNIKLTGGKMPKTPEEMMESMLKNLLDKTGKNLEEWLKIAKESNLIKHGEILKYLKSEYSITHGYANLITHMSLKI